MRRRFLITTAVVGVLCIGWSLAAPRAAAFPLRADHYKLTLFGVRQIPDMSPTATTKACGWNDPVAPCFPAPGEDGSYASLARAQWLVLAGLGITLIGLGVLRFSPTRPGPWTVFPFAIAGVLVGAAVTTVRWNVGGALAAFAGARVSMSGSGMTAAGIAALLCFIAALIAAIPRSHHRAHVKRGKRGGRICARNCVAFWEGGTQYQHACQDPPLFSQRGKRSP
ncbi:MAG: hypothetical protein ABIU86_07945 [Gemmatimonadaceae bacterium]